MFKKIKTFAVSALLVMSGVLFMQTKTNAEEFNPEVYGTLSKAGDYVEVKDIRSTRGIWIKYVSTTDDFMYVYTDAKNGDPIIYACDEKGNEVGRYDNVITTFDGYSDMAKTGNRHNSEIHIRLTKGKVYYLFAGYIGGTDIEDYKVYLVKDEEIPYIEATYSEKVKDGDSSTTVTKYLDEIGTSVKGLSYDRDNLTLTMNNATLKGTFKFDLGQAENILSDGYVDVKILGKNTTECSGLTLFGSMVALKFTGDGTLDVKDKSYDVVFINNDCLTIDGPTINILANVYSCVGARRFYIYDGRFVVTGKSTDYIIYCNCFEMNGGCINATIYPSNNKYEEVISADSIVINDGTLVLKYVDPDKNVNVEKSNGIFVASKLIDVENANIYIGMSDELKKSLDTKVFAIIKQYETDKTTYEVSNKVNIVWKSKIDISKCSFKLEYDKCTYDGKVKTPKVIVDGLMLDEDYTVVYSNNSKIGTAKVTITGKGIFTGEKVLEFIIEGDGAKVGTKIKDKKYIYKVTKSGSKDGKCIGEVMVTGLKKKSLKEIKIATKVKIDGVTYKVTSIGAKAFKGNKNIKKVTIGKNVKTIGANAFAGCKKLKNVRINSKKLKKIGKKAFFKKKGKKITFKVPKTKKKAYRKMIKMAKTNKYDLK